MAEKKNKGLELPQMRGQFQTQGKVTGTAKEKFYVEKSTKNNKPFRMTNFGVKINEDAAIYISLNGMEQDSIYFSKQEEVDGKKKTVTETVAWKDRFTFAKEGFRLIGVNTGVKKKKDDKGNDVNDKKVLTPYDACKEIGENLVDDVSVFVRGNIEYSTYEGRHQTKFVPTQVSLCKDVDFEAEGYVPTADFQQHILFMGIKQSEDKTKFLVDAKIINFNSIEDAEFIITEVSLANLFRKNLKPYTSIKVWGKINVEKHTEEVEASDDSWGESNSMERVNAPTTRELIITGADPKTVDTTIYTEKIIDTAIEKAKASKNAEKEFGSSDNDSWGNSNLSGDDDSGW
jgi:hypothetical protein